MINYFIRPGGAYVKINTSTPTPTPTPTATAVPPTDTPTPTPTPSSTYVTIDTYTPSSMQCYSFYDYAAEADIAVDTNVDVEIIWNGDLGGSVTGTVTIFSGTACNTVGVATGGLINCLGENISSVNVTLDPSSSGTQIYQVGTNSTGPYPC